MVEDTNLIRIGYDPYDSNTHWYVFQNNSIKTDKTVQRSCQQSQEVHSDLDCERSKDFKKRSEN